MDEPTRRDLKRLTAAEAETSSFEAVTELRRRLQAMLERVGESGQVKRLQISAWDETGKRVAHFDLRYPEKEET